MKIILSRKGFDMSAGGCPSSIMPDGRMVSLPIPDKQSPIRYEDIQWQKDNLGRLVIELTDGRIPATHFAHLDPDILSRSLPRQSGWRPVFGQTGAAQGHLRKNGVQPGDIFLFFGLFRSVAQSAGQFAWNRRERPRHVLWGWLQIANVLEVDRCVSSEYEWSKYHTHFHRKPDKNNVLYIARESLSLPGLPEGKVGGAGAFVFFSEQLALTGPASEKPSQCELPEWFCPRDGKCPLTYHSNLHFSRVLVLRWYWVLSEGQRALLGARAV